MGQGRISKKTIESLSQCDIVSVVSDYTHLEKRGNAWWGCCPFHHEKTASFHIEEDKNLYYCFGCHAGGDIVLLFSAEDTDRIPARPLRTVFAAPSAEYNCVPAHESRYRTD